MSEPLGGISTGEILTGIVFGHPSIVSMASQLNNLWSANQVTFLNFYRDYLAATAQTDGSKMSMAACLLGALRAHPAVAPVLVQALGIIAPHIPETQKVIAQVQAEVMSAT